MNRPVTTVQSVLLGVLPDAPVEAQQAAGSALVRSLGLVDRPRDLKAERDYADSVASRYVTLPAGCSIRPPEPTPELLNGAWDDLAPSPLDGGLTRLLTNKPEAAMPEPTNRIAELEAELAKYVGKEPTIADEMAYLRRCLNAVYEACDQAEKQATLREQPLPVPEWVDVVRQAADGERPDNPDDRRRRIYIDGKGDGWMGQFIGHNGLRWVAPLAIFPGDAEPATKVTERTGGLHEIGRCW